MANTNAEQVFRAKAPAIIAKLLSDFPITLLDAAAIIGNAGHESLGFTKLQEMKPAVAGSRGGWGWMQWTGPRRRAFEAWCAKHGKNPSSDDANYAWLFLELKGIEGTEGRAIAKAVAAKGLDAKVEAFEQTFLRAGVKHYPSRKQWAAIALDAYHKAGSPAADYPAPEAQAAPPTLVPDLPTKPASGRSGIPRWLIAAGILVAIAAAVYLAITVRF